MPAKRRFDVMLSSTFWDLEEKRKQVVGLMGRHDLHDIAMENDAALPSMDKIESSLSKVNRAAAYICIIGYRYGTREYCERRNPDNLSLTELEFRRARERGIPRCTLIMSGQYRGIPLSDYEAVSAEDRASLAAFRKLARSDRVCASYDDDADFTVKAMQSLDQLRGDLDALEKADAEAAATPARQSPDDIAPAVVPPAFHYVRKPYVEKQGFAGRVAELALIDQWSTGGEAMLLFQAIGGMGKSMLTWHWVKNRAPRVRTDWAGQLWYSFYEQGADLNDFCVHALAYIRRQPPKKFRGRRTLDLGDELLHELDARPWLLILDGLERVLVAYNRAGKEHMTDEEAVVARDGMGLDREPRSCFRPEDDDVLAMLAQAGRGRLLASSRLTPTALTNSAHQPIPGVRHVALEGLASEDAEQVLRNARVRGDGWRMRRFLADNFAGHPLSVGAVAGQVATFLEARGDFDGWVEHPRGGADPALIAKDLRGRQNHILARAFDDLDDDTKALLGSIAMASIELTPDVLRILNPKRPIEPPKVDPPEKWTEEQLYYSTRDVDIDKAYRAWTDAKSPDERAAAQVKLDEFREKNFAERKRTYDTHVADHVVWQQRAGEADAWLERTLPDLEARGFLQYDAGSNSLDMHPAIRHTALAGLSPEAKTSTGSHVSDTLSSRPLKPFEEARTREDLALAITRVEALNAGGKFNDGWQLFNASGLAGALFRLQYSHERLELMQPYFPQGWEHGPILLPKDDQAYAAFAAALSLNDAGRPQPARILNIRSIKMDLTGATTSAAALSNLANSLNAEGQRAHAERLRSLAIHLAEANSDDDVLLGIRANQANDYIAQGRLGEAEAILVTSREAIRDKEVVAAREAEIVRSDLELAFRTGCLTEQIAELSLNRVRALGERFDERASLSSIAKWRQSNDQHQDALDSFGDLIALANEIGWPHLPNYEARRAVSLAALGRQEEARRIAAKVDHGKKPPHIELALLYVELGDRAKAREHARAWAEGPPYHYHWDLEDCRKVLAAVGEPEPQLPPFDPSKVEPFDFEPDVERLIEKTLAEKAKAAEEEAKRDAARQAGAAKKAGAAAQPSEPAAAPGRRSPWRRLLPRWS